MPYGFNTDDFNKFSQDIINAGGDQATLTTLLSDMQTTFTENIAKGVSDAADIKRLSDENERLRTANMELFLRVGEYQKTKTGEPSAPAQDADEVGVDGFMQSYFEKLDKK